MQGYLNPEELSNWKSVKLVWARKYDDRHSAYVAEQIAGLLGLPLLGSGSARAVLLLRRGLVLKVALGSMGLWQMNREAMFWDMFPESVRSYFVPCLASGEGWAIYPRVKPYTQKSSNAVRDRIRDTLCYLITMGVQPFDIDPDEESYALTNWGTYQGRMVILDYAFQWKGDAKKAA
jgi:hypothetical protein